MTVISAAGATPGHCDASRAPARPVARLAAALLLGLLLALGACSSGDETATTAASSAPDCQNGTTAADIAADVPAWIADHFTCIRATMSGADVVIATQDLPPYASYYYGPGHPSYDPTPPTTPNPNRIQAQTVTLTVPASPALAGGTTAAPLGPVGVAVDGVAIFNDDANPPDVLADELPTMDANGGHPTASGVYHYHFEPPRLSSDDAALIGIAMDGFPIYGKRDEDGTVPTFPAGQNWHAHATMRFPGGVPHYHVVTGNTQTDSQGATVEVPYMINRLGGTAGTVTSAP